MGRSNEMNQWQSRLKGVTDRQRWAARGTTFKANARATKAVWFPTEATKSGKKTASKVKTATRGTATKTSRRTS
jgi:hypothetical protein